MYPINQYHFTSRSFRLYKVILLRQNSFFPSPSGNLCISTLKIITYSQRLPHYIKYILHESWLWSFWSSYHNYSYSIIIIFNLYWCTKWDKVLHCMLLLWTALLSTVLLLLLPRGLSLGPKIPESIADALYEGNGWASSPQQAVSVLPCESSLECSTAPAGLRHVHGPKKNHHHHSLNELPAVNNIFDSGLKGI
jgi:hypothetical protein